MVKKLVVTAVLALTLSGCSGTAEAEVKPSASVPTEATTTYSPDELCGYLSEQLPTLRALGDEISAMTRITMAMVTFFQQHGGLENADGRVADEIAVSGCPSVRDEVVSLAGVSSLGNL